MEIILKSQSPDRQSVVRALERFGRDELLPAPAIQAADLALEEHLTNVLTHGFDDDDAHDIVIRLSVEGACLMVEVEDDGKPFNPLAAPAVDTRPLEDRPIGGLGVHLMRQFMDELSYSREAAKNILRMKKHFTSPAD